MNIFLLIVAKIILYGWLNGYFKTISSMGPRDSLNRMNHFIEILLPLLFAFLLSIQIGICFGILHWAAMSLIHKYMHIERHKIELKEYIEEVERSHINCDINILKKIRYSDSPKLWNGLLYPFIGRVDKKILAWLRKK